MKKYISRVIIVFFFIVLLIFIGSFLKACFDRTIGGLDENKIQNLKGVPNEQ